MDEQKSVKIRVELHEEISDRADLLGMKLGRYCEALLSAALKLDNDAIIEEVKKLAKITR